MKILRTVEDMGAALTTRRGGLVGLVPTMGAFHDGHRSLFAAARARCRVVVVSLFVNPTQFGDPADLARYPRDEARDREIAEQSGVDLIFAPASETMYPGGFDTSVDVGRLGTILEGVSRPGHFKGVATVCLKLFNIVEPDIAFFGQKDAQQVEVIRRMVRDLNLDLELAVLPTVRDADGLALSSRNVLLSEEDRRRALALPRALATMNVANARALLDDLDVDYVEEAPFTPPVIAAGIRGGRVRLIDNVILPRDKS